MNPNRRQHSVQQRRLVLAISIPAMENIRCWMRLQPTDAHLNDEVSDLSLSELANSLGLVVKLRLAPR